MRKYFLLTLLLTLGTAPALLSDDLRVFKASCMSCHGKSVPMVRPVDKARIQWERFFRRDVHRPRLELDEGVRKHVLSFLYDHAADSDQPMVPGL